MGLELSGLTKRFGSRAAVDHVSLEVNDGEFVVLLGPSGCGKSTLLRMVAGLETPDEGSVRMGGQDITHLAPRDRDVAMVFQSYALYPHMRVAENIAYPLRVRRRSREEISKEVTRVASRLGLDGLLAHYPRQLSGGERQRVALARAIIRHPKAFLMDEPLSNLDARLRVQVRGELKHLQHELKTATLYVTHDQAEAMTLAHRIALLCNGRLLQYDTPWNIYHRPANLFAAGFVGSPPMNLISGRVQSGLFAAPGIVIPLPAEILQRIDGRAEVTLGVRPEDLEFSPVEQPGWSPARVYVTEEMGNETYVRLAAGETQITLRAAGDIHIELDAPAWFRPRLDRLHVFDSTTTEALR